MELIPIQEKLEENEQFLNRPDCQDTLYQCIEFYKKAGFVPPWICYYVKQEDTLIGSAGFKGPPVNGSVEIAYGVMEPFRRKGIGTGICKLLTDLAANTDSTLKITARTFPEYNFSVRILQKNGFLFTGDVLDPEDGIVWEWVYPHGA